MQFTSKELDTIQNALKIAADQFKVDAEVCKETARIKEQFEKQEKEARELLNRIEEERP